MLQLLPIFVLMIGFMWWMTRKQKADQARVASMQSSLQVGDRVVTASGMYGTVVDADEVTVDLEIAEDVVTTWLRSAVREVRVEPTDTVSDPSEGEPAEDLFKSSGDFRPTGYPSIESIDPDKD